LAALFPNGEDAGKAYSALLDLGYSRDQISFVMTDEARRRYFVTEDTDRADESKALEGMGVGGAIGGAAGAIIAAIAAIGANVVIPGLGLVVVGPLTAALVGAGAGGVTGGLIGALVGAGIPEETAKVFEAGVRAGGVILSVRPESIVEAERVADTWERCGGELIHPSKP
jgi:hypothetical protein